MSIQTTIEVSRESAIERIRRIANLVAQRRFLEIERVSFESEDDFREFVFHEKVDPDELDNLEQWTNGMLEERLDKPFYRWSMFENYVVVHSLRENQNDTGRSRRLCN